jgi:Fur family transcriptional regulator, ferric uptake regulator
MRLSPITSEIGGTERHAPPLPGAGPVTGASSGSDAPLHELVEVRLRRADLRYTSGRRAIVELLAAVGHPVSISDIAVRLPEVPRSSAYRHLVDLQGAGVVRRIAANDEFARFELAEDLTEHHHHLLCTSCGRVIDVTPTPAFERTVAKMVLVLADQQGFRPTSHALDVMGHCAQCG